MNFHPHAGTVEEINEINEIIIEIIEINEQENNFEHVQPEHLCNEVNSTVKVFAFRIYYHCKQIYKYFIAFLFISLIDTCRNTNHR